MTIEFAVENVGQLELESLYPQDGDVVMSDPEGNHVSFPQDKLNVLSDSAVRKDNRKIRGTVENSEGQKPIVLIIENSQNGNDASLDFTFGYLSEDMSYKPVKSTSKINMFDEKSERELSVGRGTKKLLQAYNNQKMSTFFGNDKGGLNESVIIKDLYEKPNYGGIMGFISDLMQGISEEEIFQFEANPQGTRTENTDKLEMIVAVKQLFEDGVKAMTDRFVTTQNPIEAAGNLQYQMIEGILGTTFAEMGKVATFGKDNLHMYPSTSRDKKYTIFDLIHKSYRNKNSSLYNSLGYKDARHQFVNERLKSEILNIENAPLTGSAKSYMSLTGARFSGEINDFGGLFGKLNELDADFPDFRNPVWRMIMIEHLKGKFPKMVDQLSSFLGKYCPIRYSDGTIPSIMPNKDYGGDDIWDKSDQYTGLDMMLGTNNYSQAFSDIARYYGFDSKD